MQNKINSDCSIFFSYIRIACIEIERFTKWTLTIDSNALYRNEIHISWVIVVLTRPFSDMNPHYTLIRITTTVSQMCTELFFGLGWKCTKGQESELCYIIVCMWCDAMRWWRVSARSLQDWRCPSSCRPLSDLASVFVLLSLETILHTFQHFIYSCILSDFHLLVFFITFSDYFHWKFNPIATPSRLISYTRSRS